MLAQRGIEASYEMVRCWTLKFGRACAQNLRRSRPKPTGCWHLGQEDQQLLRDAVREVLLLLVRASAHVPAV